MTPVTVLAPAKLAPGVTEDQLLAGSQKFQDDFVAHEPGVLRREIVRKPDGTYIDIVQFRSEADMADVIAKEMNSPICAAFFALMDLSDYDPEAPMESNVSLATYTR